MRGTLNFLGSPAVGQAGINILKTFLALILLWASAFFPAAGWHRLFLKIHGWYWWPVAGFLAVFGIFTSFLVHQQTWLLMAFPIPFLFAHDCVLVLVSIWSKKRGSHV